MKVRFQIAGFWLGCIVLSLLIWYGILSVALEAMR